MSIKKMPIEEKHDKLMDAFLMTYATMHALIKELGAEDRFLDSYVKMMKSMLPSFMGIAFSVLKAITPGRAFRQVMDQIAYSQQTMIPLSNIEYTRVSDREATLRIKNCPVIKRMGDLVKKAGLDIDPREMCEVDAKMIPEMSKEFGIDVSMELEENGCVSTAKMK